MRPVFFRFFLFLVFHLPTSKKHYSLQNLNFLYNRLTYYSKDRFKKIENFYKIFAQKVQPKTYFLHDT